MQIKATITSISYEPLLSEQLQVFDLLEFDVNRVPTACIVKSQHTTFALSRWVSPKRTRSYPYERVYNTLGISKKITVIPIIKDEGQSGDRDYLQWDTVSLMSLLDVFVIFAYYERADAAGLKITNQQFDNDYVVSKIREIQHFHSSALHWNLHELEHGFDTLLAKVKMCYANIAATTGIKLHSFIGIDRFRTKIDNDMAKFKVFSREKAAQAQAREVVTTQPKEVLATLTKAKITITNYLGGAYFFTLDEVAVQGDTLHLIEAKHTKNALIPNKSDIKDGLLKMILYCNFERATIGEQTYRTRAVLKLTSARLTSSINSTLPDDAVDAFILQNEFSHTQSLFLRQLIKEAQTNNFTILLEPTQLSTTTL